MLYMFQAVSPPIIRSSKTVHTASGIVKLFCCLGGLELTHASGKKVKQPRYRPGVAQRVPGS
jgi:hypothetical protein